MTHKWTFGPPIPRPSFRRSLMWPGRISNGVADALTALKAGVKTLYMPDDVEPAPDDAPSSASSGVTGQSAFAFIRSTSLIDMATRCNSARSGALSGYAAWSFAFSSASSPSTPSFELARST